MIEWFTRNSVAANLLMVSIIGVGLYVGMNKVVLEVFPEFESNIVNVRMSYRGATPTEIEEGIIIKIEEAIQDLEGIKEIKSTANEQSGTVAIEVEEGVEPRELLDDIKNRVDAINTFPTEADEPSFSIANRKREVISVVIHGNVDEATLRQLGERVRDDLTSTDAITQVELTEIRPFEIAIEVSETTLAAYGITFDDVVGAINRSSLDLPAGTLKTAGGEILLRSKGQAYTGAEFAELVVLRRLDGTQVTLGEIAKINDGFDEDPLRAQFDGEPCVVLEVYRVGNQDAIEVADAVKAYLKSGQAQLPDGVKADYWRDRSDLIKGRLNLLLWNAGQGILLVILVLGLFLRPSLAFWVCLGIPISFLGSLALLPVLGITINIMSVFAFILVLGIVVDDAIVTGENIYTHLKQGKDATRATIEGVQEVAVPVTFGVLTTVAAFLPLAFMAGRRGPIFAQIPFIVIPVLLFSLIESKLILPAHLKHTKLASDSDNFLSRFQQRIADGLDVFSRRLYTPVLRFVLAYRYQTVIVLTTNLAVIIVAVLTGHMKWSFFPRIPSETATATLEMPLGTDFEITSRYIDRINAAAIALQQKHIDPSTGKSIIEHIQATAGSTGGSTPQSHIGRVRFEMTPAETRGEGTPKNEDLMREWQKGIGILPGVKDLNYRAEIGRGGDPIDIQLSGHDLDRLQTIADLVKAKLATYPGLFGITDSFSDGKVEVQIHLKPEAESLGIDQLTLARQVRQAFSGAEAQEIQRGRDDMKVMVRYPLSERQSLGSLESMRIRTASGAEVPISQVAELEVSRGFAQITRIDRRRTLNIVADANKDTTDLTAIAKDLNVFIPELLQDYPGVRYSLEGEMREQNESFVSLVGGLAIVLCVIYMLLAIPMKSYLQPLLVMCVIPFGWGGAIVGHWIMGMGLSIFSVLGMLALTGVVVNDSLVMIDFINRRRLAHDSLMHAVRTAGVDRFRAILLTSLTTFAGLSPIIMEKSTQAQFLIPMAVSLGFGVLFATVITLLMVPVVYLILEDFLRAWRWIYNQPDPHAADEAYDGLPSPEPPDAGLPVG